MFICKVLKFIDYKVIGRLRCLILRIKYKSNASFVFYNKFISKNLKIDLSKQSKVSIDTICEGAGIVKINVREDAELRINKGVCINSGCIFTVREKLVIDEDTMLGPNVLIYDHDHDYRRSDWKSSYKCKEIYIGKNVWIGAGSIILKGSNIGDNSVIAAGSIVSGNVPANSIYKNKLSAEIIEFERADYEL